MRFISYTARMAVLTTMITGAALMGVMVGYAIGERVNQHEN